MSDTLPSQSVVCRCFVDLLRELRTAKYPSASAFDPVRYTRYARGEVEPTLTFIVHTCIGLGVAPNDLFPGLAKLNAAAANEA